MYDPVKELRGLGVHIRRADLRAAWAIWVPGKSAVVLATGLTRVQERCILAHQAHHLVGDDPAVADPYERERLADLGAAARLIDERQAHKVLSATTRADHAAEALGVTRRVLDTWLDWNHTAKGIRTPWPTTAYEFECAVPTIGP